MKRRNYDRGTVDPCIGSLVSRCTVVQNSLVVFIKDAFLKSTLGFDLLQATVLLHSFKKFKLEITIVTLSMLFFVKTHFQVPEIRHLPNASREKVALFHSVNDTNVKVLKITLLHSTKKGRKGFGPQELSL